MSICLASTWHPRGEIARFERFLPVILERYTAAVVIVVPGDDPESLYWVEEHQFSSPSPLVLHINNDLKSGRYTALMFAVESGLDFIHYVDMDRLLHWIETNPEEWVQMVQEIPQHDCIIFGRTQKATTTHPEALVTTEQISNQVVSYFLNQSMDVSAGSKSFSREAAQYLIEHCRINNSIGTDAEWPIMIKRSGFHMEYIQVNGLEWESADQYQDHAVTGEIQERAAHEYDADPNHWLGRVEIASEIVKTAMDVAQRKLPPAEVKTAGNMLFDFDAVFDVDDYMYFYSEALTDERTDREVSALVSLLGLGEPRRILDLACGFGRHTNRLALMGNEMTGVDRSKGFLELARIDAEKRGVRVNYQQGDMRQISFNNEYEVVMLLFTAFGYFSEEENLQVLKNVSQALVPGGMFIFDMPNRDTFIKYRQPYFVTEKDGNLMIDRESFDSITGKSYNQRIVIRDGIRKDKPFSIRLYNPNEIKALLTGAHLDLEHFYGGWDGQELNPESRRLVVVARKPV